MCQWDSLLKGLDKESAPARLQLANHELGETGARHVSEFLSKYTTLTRLGLANNQLGDRGVEHIVNNLCQSTILRHLDLDGNRIGPAGAACLVTALQRGCALVRLELEFNAIKDSGARRFADLLEDNFTLTHLNLRHNSISDDGACRLAQALSGNTVLMHLNLADQRSNSGLDMITGRTLQEFSVTLLTNRTLVRLDVSGNHVSKESVGQVLSALEHNFTLKQLDLGMLGAAHAEQLSNKLEINRSPDLLVQLTLQPEVQSSNGNVSIHDALLTCSTLNGDELAVLTVDMREDSLRNVYTRIADITETPPQKLRLLTPGGRLLEEIDFETSFIDVFFADQLTLRGSTPSSDIKT